MTSRNFSRRWVAVAALVGLSGASQAALSVFTDQAAFLKAVTAPETLTFEDLPVSGPGLPVSGPLFMTAGAYSDTASASGSAIDPTIPVNSFYSAGSASDLWLTTNASDSAITFSGFSPNVRAVGGYFFASDIEGNPVANHAISVLAVDGSGLSSLQRFSDTTPTSFLGFVSTGPLISVTVSAEQLVVYTWPTVNNLILATAVPEPETYALLLAGLAVVGFVARRRRA